MTSFTNTKSLPHLPKPMQQPIIANSRMLDDDAKIYLWKLIHTWLRHEKLQTKWATVINDLLLRIIQSYNSEARSVSKTTTSLGTYIQLFETGTPSQSKFLSGHIDGTQLQNLTDLPLPIVYGGTVRLYGVPVSLQATLNEIMALALYTVYSLQLEVDLMRDHHITISTHLTKPDTVLAQDSPLTGNKKTTNITTTTTAGALWKHGLLGWVFGKRGGDKAVVNEKDSNIEAPKRRLSFMALKNSTRKPTVNPPDLSDSDHYYQHLRLALERACISTSPSLTFTAPSLVTVLEYEEENMNTMKVIIRNGQQKEDDESSTIKKQQQRFSDQQPLRNRLTSLARRSSSILSIGPTDKGNKNDHDTVFLPQSITAYNLLRIPKHLLNTTNKIGMDQLYLDPTSIGAFKHHQHIVINYSSYPIGCPDRPCLGPTLCTIQYFRFDDESPYSDQTLGMTLNRWLNESTNSCKNYLDHQARACTDLIGLPTSPRRAETQDRISVTSDHTSSDELSSQQRSTTNTKMSLHGCKQPLQDHVLCFSHGSSRINVYFISSEITTTTTTIGDNPSLTCWLVCTICDARTPSRPVSQATSRFSFAKYLELYLYSTRFSTPHDLCQHAKTTAIARCFSHVNMTTEIRFVKEDIDVYRLRGSPLQAIQQSSSSFYPRISKSTMEKWVIREGRAIEDLFKHLQRHLVKLQHQQPDGRPDKDMMNRQAVWDSNRHDLLQSLKNASIALNDFRRFFAMEASVIVDDLNHWQQDRWPQLAPFTWKGRPDYMNTDINETIHCFPDSAVMVRELEPTSIIAYTLSSKDYVDELSYNLSSEGIPTATTVPASKKAAPPLSTKSSSGQNSSNEDDPSEMIDGYYSTVERKYISPTTGSATETASFRTMVMETVRNNVSDHRISLMKQRLARTAPLSLSTRKIKRQQTTERDLGLQTAKDIKESIVYHNPPPPTEAGSDEIDPSSPDGPATLLSPHIKHRFVHGNVEFSCTVYYANEFESLRKSCGVDQLVIESLCRCQNWATTGGKSKSQFYKTQDDRLVVKEMVNAWNIAEKDAFLRFAPKYFDYIRESDKAPSLLAKIFGFYSIQMQSTDDKKQTFNIDVLVMEQLFYGQSISKTFDFKGIPDRQVDEERRNQDGCTLWDGDWRDGYRMGYVTHEQSWQWIDLAIERDTQFLANNNIMDYSLLVGVDKSKKELSIGLVDYIGTYTWYKKIESKSKSTLQRNREVTVLPPDQYRLRFCRQVRDYFIPVPGKFDIISPEQTNPSAWIK
ncbi:hypothetical protein BC941DRAFT_387495 [Chlamydoabsidia padenii]|nr:hypothetical protein BC941DRAFT_387495 [Chlamydoabsidia padenii]